MIIHGGNPSRGAVRWRVSADDTGIAAGVNTALRELGGVFGVVILAAVFAHNGSYATPAAFIDGFQPAMGIAAAVPLVGAASALFMPGKQPSAALAPRSGTARISAD